MPLTLATSFRACECGDNDDNDDEEEDNEEENEDGVVMVVVVLISCPWLPHTMGRVL